MTIKRTIQIFLFALLLCLQACAVPTNTSERYRVLTVPMMESVKVGMTQDEAWRILGKPWNWVTYALNSNESYNNWKWRNDQQEIMTFSVVLDKNNRVIRTEAWLDVRGRRGNNLSGWN
jgi:outer membrane protein assembly factor BamE (lipoprotein component of BamABCDE complex)